MLRSAEWLSRWIHILAAGLYVVAVFLRTWLYFQNGSDIECAMGLLLVWSLLLISEPVISRRWSAYFPIYLIFQTSLVFVLMALPGTPDFMGTLLGVLSMQVILRLPIRVGAVWIGLCALIMMVILWKEFQSQTIALTLIYTAGNVFISSYTLTIRRAQAARLKSQALASKLEQANCQLQEYANQVEQLAAARERSRLARDLHDSVTQTVFSMNLNSQSAKLLFERDRGQVGGKLENLYELARSALAEMQLLIDELKPPPAQQAGLLDALRQLLDDSRLMNGLTVSIDAQGNQALSPFEEQGLCRIVLEALNNIRKHACTSQAQVRLHLLEPFWVEIRDHGQGFDLSQARHSGGFGLASMGERAAEIGWNLQIETSPGAGACIRVEKPAQQEVADG